MINPDRSYRYRTNFKCLAGKVNQVHLGSAGVFIGIKNVVEN